MSKIWGFFWARREKRVYNILGQEGHTQQILCATCYHITFSFSAPCHLSLKKVLLVTEVCACLSQSEHMCM